MQKTTHFSLCVRLTKSTGVSLAFREHSVFRVVLCSTPRGYCIQIYLFIFYLFNFIFGLFFFFVVRSFFGLVGWPTLCALLLSLIMSCVLVSSKC